MKRRYFFLSVSLLLNLFAFAQERINPEGVYSLRGVMEVASAFKLNPDSSFEFYFSYGALDRYGSGKWKVTGDAIILNSRPYPGNDFKLTSSTLIKNNFTTIKIKNQNADLYQYVYCINKTKNGDSLINADSNGEIILPANTDSIYLKFEFSAERVSIFKVDHTKSNSYTFIFEAWAVEVFFKNFSLQYFKDHLKGRHPLLDDKNYEYMKEE